MREEWERLSEHRHRVENTSENLDLLKQNLVSLAFVALGMLPADSLPITNVIFWLLSTAVRIALFASTKKLRSEPRRIAIGDKLPQGGSEEHIGCCWYVSYVLYCKICMYIYIV